MFSDHRFLRSLAAMALLFAALPAGAASFRVQCPTSTITHPSALHDTSSEPAYAGPTTLAPGANGYLVPSANVNGAIKCQQISGGDGGHVEREIDDPSLGSMLQGE